MVWIGGPFLLWIAVTLASAPPAVKPMPATALPLQLSGIMLDRADPAKSACLIRCRYPEEREARFVVGQTVCDVGAIAEIRQDGVVIQNPVTRRKEWLTYPVESAAPTSQPVTPAPAPALVVAQNADVVSVDLPPAVVDYYMENLPELLTSALASPRYKDTASGRVVDGFQIGEVKDKGVVQQMGLRNGDVLLSVDGQVLDGLPTILKLLGQMQTAKQVKLTVLRGDQTLTFIFKRR